MRFIRILSVLTALFLAQSAMAQPPGPDIGRLVARVAALEANAPNPSVDNRTYCQNFTTVEFRGDTDRVNGDITRDVLTSVRRRLTFTPGEGTPGMGSWNADAVSGWMKQQFHNGFITNLIDISSPNSGTYSQSGSRLDITLGSGAARAWYVSADGSIILMQRVSDTESLFNGYDRIRILNMSLIEIGPGVDCQVELF